MIFFESPYYHVSHKPMVLLARKDGQYTRPIAGVSVDIRAEDCMPPGVNYINIIGQLPDVANQRGRFFVATMGVVDRIDLTAEEAAQFSERGYKALPANESSPYWAHSRAPWWEFATVLDEEYNYIKAPKLTRHGEPTPEEVDEQLDRFPENVGKIQVLSPKTLDDLRRAGKRPDLRRQLQAV